MSTPRRARVCARFWAAPLSAAFLWSLVSAQVAVAAGSDLFGAQGTQHDDYLAIFPQWQRVLSRLKDIPAPAGRDCRTDSNETCRLREWKEWDGLLSGLKNKDAMAQLQAVNEFMNRQPYVEDPANWGVIDYWETPLEFLRRGGDCEDYAVAKYVSLRDLGWPPESLLIVVLQDLNLNIQHAVLVAYLNGEPLVLDNQIRSIVRASNIRHYRPIYAVNERQWWSYRAAMVVGAASGR